MKPIQIAIILMIFSVLFQASVSCSLMNENSGRLHGYVYEIVEGDRHPIVFAKVSIYDGEMVVDEGVTGENGSYKFTLKPGLYTIKVEKRRYIAQTAFAVLKPNSIVNIDFHLELEVLPYEVLIIVEGLPEGLYPEVRLDGVFYGYALNGSRHIFKGDTVHAIELNEIAEDRVRYVHLEKGIHVFSESGTIMFRYFRQFYVSSNTNPWIDGWYDEGSVVYLETKELIDLGNATQLVFDAWLKDEMVLGENPISLEVNSSFHVDSKYRRQYLLTVSSERGVVEGGGWYDEGSMAEVSVGEIEVGMMPFKYRFDGWGGDLESRYATDMIVMDEPKWVHAEWERVELVRVARLDPVYKAIINISLLIFAAKILSGVFARVKLPEVLGELSAGMILGPYALGGLQVLGEPLIELNEFVLIFAEVGAILLLFIAGLEISFGQFKAVGASSAIVGVFGCVVPFFLGLYVLGFLGFPWKVNLLVAATLTATSIAITMRTLEEMGKLNSVEGGIMINAAVIDDVLGLVVLAVVLSIVTSGISPHPVDIAWLLFRTIAFWLLLLAITLTVAPRVIGAAERWKMKGTVEVVALATCFGSAVAAAAIGLSPIIGAFAAGMALATSKVIVRIRDFIERLGILFSPIFFAVIGAEFNIRALSFEGLGIILILIGIAVVSKFLGCGIPAAITLKNAKRGFRVGTGMISRGEVGLIIAGIGVTSGIMSQSIYGAVVAMVILTTVVTPIALRWAFREPRVTS